MDSDDLPLFSRGVSGETAPKAAPNPVLGSAVSDGDGRAVMTVSELNRKVRGVLEAKFELQWVSGELSNVLRAASGHWYFSLKDATAQARCVMFRNRAQALGLTPENGMQVEVRALPSLYEPRGEFQLGVEMMRRAGLGALFEAFERLKSKLSREGYFDADRKRDLPNFPHVLGIVTSTKAAALRDVLATIARRAPMVSVIIYPTAVQGSAAPAEICAALSAATQRATTDRLDALLVCRGGGSIEDLWCFNDESVARAIIAFQESAKLPVVSGVGHETDFTIADFVADVRAPTPTAAAELLTPDTPVLRASVAAQRNALTRAHARLLASLQQRLDHAARGLVSPRTRIAAERERLDGTRRQLTHALRERISAAREQLNRHQRRLQRCSPEMLLLTQRARIARLQDALRQQIDKALSEGAHRLGNATQALAHLNPHNVLGRGYALVQTRDGKLLRDATKVAVGDSIRVSLQRGVVDATVCDGIDSESH